MHNLVEALRYLNLAAFVALSGATIRLWARRRDAASFWAMLAFGDLALISIVSRLLPDDPASFVAEAVQRVDLALLLLFPFLLFRFATAFRRPGNRVVYALRALTAAMVVFTFARPSLPETGDPRSAAFEIYLIGFLVHWTTLSAFSSWRLWSAGSGQPSVARRRMRFLAAASAMLTLALFFAAGASADDGPLSAAAQGLAFVSLVAFLLGLSPPLLLRVSWRVPEQRRLQDAIGSLVALATTRAEVAGRVLEPMAALVGARAVALRGSDGETIAAYGSPGGDDEGVEVLELEVPGGSLVVWTNPYAPFFGEDELYLLRTLAALTGIALDRVRLFEQEHEARLALERTNEVMANFVALAAHELRTPVTTINGFVHTLNHLGDRLSPEQQREVRETLEQQTERMVLLVEQLLDLSRLDAEAVDIVPQRVYVRRRLEQVLDAAAGTGYRVDLAVDEELQAEVDPNAFDRIVSNLLTNALRYGDPPVVVRAERNDRHFRVVVEDNGLGVPLEFVPDLFERFTRADADRARASGTGLGLAIARSYARAHGGDLLYEPGSPRGARFSFVLPVRRATV